MKCVFIRYELAYLIETGRGALVFGFRSWVFGLLGDLVRIQS